MIKLDREFTAYQQRLPELLVTHPGSYVVIKGDTIVNFHNSYEEALDWAYDHFGLTQFFIKEITESRPVTHYTRAIRP
ncbi:hypothetical protein [Methylibium petroleiphilum]